MIHLDVAKVDLVLHMLQWLYTYVLVYVLNVPAVLNVCCKCFIWILHIAVVCYKCMFQMFHLFQTYVASVLSGVAILCFRRMFLGCA
jgi:hypothetical protein